MSLEFLYRKPLNHAKSLYDKSMGHMKRLLIGDAPSAGDPAVVVDTKAGNEVSASTDHGSTDGTTKDGEAEKVAEKVIKASFPTGYFTEEIIENGSVG